MKVVERVFVSGKTVSEKAKDAMVKINPSFSFVTLRDWVFLYCNVLNVVYPHFPAATLSLCRHSASQHKRNGKVK